MTPPGSVDPGAPCCQMAATSGAPRDRSKKARRHPTRASTERYATNRCSRAAPIDRCELLLEDEVLLLEVVDDLQLAVVDPAGHPYEQEPQGLGTHRGAIVAPPAIDIFPSSSELSSICSMLSSESGAGTPRGARGPAACCLVDDLDFLRRPRSRSRLAARHATPRKPFD